jgi:hypothetical protein
MNRRHIFSLSVIPALALMLSGAATAQQQTLKEQLAGTWTAVSWEQVGKDGSKFERFGANPKGVNSSTRTADSLSSSRVPTFRSLRRKIR